MRLDHLHLPRFKNLQDFDITFSGSIATVLVGPNGTGKSNVLEALTIIFRDLDLGAPPSLPYTLSYQTRGAQVTIEAEPSVSGRGSLSILVDGEKWTSERFSRRGGGEHLPGFVFGYYSGPSNRMEQHFEAHQARFAADLLEGTDRPLRPLLYARQVHSQFVLLSFFAQQEREADDVLSRFLRIESLDSVLFVLKRPDWYSKGRAVEGDPRFWGARGVVRDFLDQIHKIALAPMRRSRPRDNLYLYLKNQQDLIDLAGSYSSQAEFFKALESLYISDLIEDVRTRVRMKGADGALTFRELSEGEQQLLTVLGLLKFIEGEEGLILLDEPDTHLNPIWSLQYTSLLAQHVADSSTTHIVMATHDPLVVAGLVKDEVRMMRTGPENTVVAQIPDEDPRGMGVAGLLTSELYGLRSQLDLETLSLLDQKRRLASKEHLTDQEKIELQSLNEKLETLDFNRVTRDPLYKPYVDAMSQLEPQLGLLKATLSSDDIDRRHRLADDVVRSLLSRLGEDQT